MTRYSEQGLTFLEVLVALVILAFVLLGSANLMILTMHENDIAGKRSLATSLAAERIEMLTSGSYHIEPSFGSYIIPGEVSVTGPPHRLVAGYGDIPNHPGFRRALTLSYGVPNAGILKATAEVFWVDLVQGEKRHKITTLIHPGHEHGI